MENGLNYKFHNAWDLIFEIYFTIYKNLVTAENYNHVSF